MDHTIATLSRCKVVQIPRTQILELTERPAIARALWWAALVDEATLREWLLNVGARNAEQRIAHLLCELLRRLEVVGLTNYGSYELPITQVELAETVGLSDVHVSRVLQRLRVKKLITLSRKKLVILDVPALNAFSGFDPNYLHLNGRYGIKDKSA
jgi:CRP-like cAMP-binding protein